MRPLTVLALSTAPLLSEIKLDPTFHFNGVVGDTSADAFRDIGGHPHDPNDNFAVQGFEPGLNLRVDDWLAGFTNVNVFTTSDHDIDWELEEAFLKLHNLPAASKSGADACSIELASRTTNTSMPGTSSTPTSPPPSFWVRRACSPRVSS